MSSSMGANTSSASTVATETVAEAKADDDNINPILKRLKRNDPSISSLRVIPDRDHRGNGYFHSRSPEDWRHLSEAIVTNTNLRRLDLQNLRYDHIAIQSLKEFYVRLNKNTSLRRLALHQIDLYDGEIFTEHILQFLVENASLTSLSATSYSLGLEGTSLLTLALCRRTTSLMYLNLSNAGITDEACQELVVGELRTGHCKLRSLELNGNSIQNGGCAAIAEHLLGNPNSTLSRVYLDNNSIDDEGAEALADGLANNTCLKTLSIHQNKAITKRGYEAFSKALCNARSIGDILISNHKIQRLGANCSQLSAELKSSLRFNRVANKHYVSNRKVVMYHFVYNCNMDLFGGIPGSLLPRVIATIANHSIFNNNRTDAKASEENSFAKNDYKIRHLALHRIIRLCPLVCERHVGTNGGAVANSAEATKRIRLS